MMQRLGTATLFLLLAVVLVQTVNAVPLLQNATIGSLLAMSPKVPPSPIATMTPSATNASLSPSDSNTFFLPLVLRQHRANSTPASPDVNPNGERMPNAPRISPDGRQIGYLYRATGGVEHGLYWRVGGVENYTLATVPLPFYCDYYFGVTQYISMSG